MTNLSSHLSAREQVAALTKERVMAALAATLRDGCDVTFDLVAKRSGVPLRTVYRHFETKEALFGAFWQWANTLIEVPGPPMTPAEVIDHIPALFAAFDRDELLVRAMMHDPHGRDIRLANANTRREKFRTALAPVIEPLPDSEAQRLLAVVTVLCSASGWESMKDNWSLSGEEAAAAAQWAVEIMIRKAGLPDGPG